MKAILLAMLLAPFATTFAQRSMDPLRVTHIKENIAVSALDDQSWAHARGVRISTYWSGEAAPATRSFEARLLWSSDALYVRFDAEQHEPLVVSERPDLTKKVNGVWDRDVCEIFIAPDRSTPNKYFEFEIAPTGEWIDLGIEVTPAKRLTDMDYTSGMESFAKVDGNKVVEIIRVPFKSLGRTPKKEDVWLGNLFRCVGKDPTRGYLSWRPTRTKKPSFHVPKAFGEIKFVA